MKSSCYVYRCCVLVHAKAEISNVDFVMGHQITGFTSPSEHSGHWFGEGFCERRIPAGRD